VSILEGAHVSIQHQRAEFVPAVGQNQDRFVKNNNALPIDAALSQEVVHWHVLLELVKEMRKILAQVGHV